MTKKEVLDLKSDAMFAIIYLLGTFVADLLKSRRRLHQLKG
jgi:hypothetical protein